MHVTHTQPEAIALADTVVVMDHGRIDRAGTANEIFNRPTTPYVARFMGGQNVLAGTVESASGAMARLRGPRGELFEAPLSPAPTIGTPVSIAIPFTSGGHLVRRRSSSRTASPASSNNAQKPYSEE